ncbi:hypothetical protein [Crocosphaera watsonii]|nr:hypothetical protein [Crocosphaera watsonii]
MSAYRVFSGGLDSLPIFIAQRFDELDFVRSHRLLRLVRCK